MVVGPTEPGRPGEGEDHMPERAGTEHPSVRGTAWKDMVVVNVWCTWARTVTETDLVNFVTRCGFTEARPGPRCGRPGLRASAAR